MLNNLKQAQTKAEPLSARAERAAIIAATHANTVDVEARFPDEAVAALKAENLFGVMVPDRLAENEHRRQRCGRCLLRAGPRLRLHRDDLCDAPGEGRLRRSPRRRQPLARRLHPPPGARPAAARLLDHRRRRRRQRPLQRGADRAAGGRIRLERAASVISYGAEADAVVTTARRNADAAASDQVLAVFSKDDYTLERTLTWDTLGMRGTCSAGFTLRASGDADQILPAPYELIHAQSMVPAAHILWSSAWAGVAAAAVEKARKYLRKARARRRRDCRPARPTSPAPTRAARAARPDRHHPRPLRGDQGRSRRADGDGLPVRDQPPEGRRLGAGGARR